MNHRLVLSFFADTADEAMTKAREWGRIEPRLRFQRVVTCRRVSPDYLPPRWEVTVVMVDVPT